MISAVITGNICGDATRREVNGDTVVSFRMASRRYDYKLKQEIADFIGIEAWGKRAASAFQFLNKGKTVAVRGTMYVREYSHNGQVKFSLECKADDVELLGSNTASVPVVQSEDIPF